MGREGRYRFGEFELDGVAGELRRKGIRIRLHVQPVTVLLLLVDRAGEVVTREEICRELWPDGSYVDFEHGVNSCVNRLREALGDKAASPRYVETLARRGYRFVAPVERVDVAAPAVADTVGWLAGEADLAPARAGVPTLLFGLLQVMYLGFYVGALANLREIHELMEPLPLAVFYLLVVSAATLIPLRVFLASAAAFRAPRFRGQFLRIWPAVLVADLLWALSPFLLLHHMNAGAALACCAPLVYAPFAQRALVLMGAGE